MPGTATSRRSLRCRSRGKRSRLQPHATRRSTRLASSGQLMAQGRGLLIPRLGSVPLAHRLVADDGLAVMLAKALVELDIAVPGDWKWAERDPTSFIRITLERWIDAHGGPAIRHRFLLSTVTSNTPCEWAERDETKPTQLFLIVEPSEASRGCRSSPPSSAAWPGRRSGCREGPRAWLDCARPGLAARSAPESQSSPPDGSGRGAARSSAALAATESRCSPVFQPRRHPSAAAPSGCQ